MQYNGQKGVELAIKMLKEEFAVTMRLAGLVCPSSHQATNKQLTLMEDVRQSRTSHQTDWHI